MKNIRQGKTLTKEIQTCLENLRNPTTCMKAQITKYSVNCYINKQMTTVKKTTRKETRRFNFGEKHTGRPTE